MSSRIAAASVRIFAGSRAVVNISTMRAWMEARVAGEPVSVASATCDTKNVARPAADVNGMDAAQAFQIVHVRPETITHTVVPVTDAPTGDHFSLEWLERMARLSPDERLEAFSRKR